MSHVGHWNELECRSCGKVGTVLERLVVEFFRVLLFFLVYLLIHHVHQWVILSASLSGPSKLFLRNTSVALSFFSLSDSASTFLSRYHFVSKVFAHLLSKFGTELISPFEFLMPDDFVIHSSETIHVPRLQVRVMESIVEVFSFFTSKFFYLISPPEECFSVLEGTGNEVLVSNFINGFICHLA